MVTRWIRSNGRFCVFGERTSPCSSKTEKSGQQAVSVPLPTLFFCGDDTKIFFTYKRVCFVSGENSTRIFKTLPSVYACMENFTKIFLLTRVSRLLLCKNFPNFSESSLFKHALFVIFSDVKICNNFSHISVSTM